MTTEWFISGNPTKYDVVSAFKELNKIDWKQTTNVAVGDIIYLYVSQGYQSVKYKCRVNKIDLTSLEIDDRKFDITGEFDGTYGRYMEIELIKELNGVMYSKVLMEKHGFKPPQSAIRVKPQTKEYLDLIEKLQGTAELQPDKHDGSYELIRETINSYKNMGDLSKINYKDLNLIYLMTVGTWKQKLPAKKRTINDSNLPEIEKQRLIDLLNKIWDKAEKNEYENKDAGKASVGMFGTGFFSFKGKTDEISPRRFVQMCIDIKEMTNEEAIFARCGQTLTKQFHGMKTASASMILHCLKPTVFPIFNSNMGSNNIYNYLGVDMENITEIDTYIENCRLVKNFRDVNFNIKNYRIFDMAAWSIGKIEQHTSIDYLGVMDYLEKNRKVPYSDPEAKGLDKKERKRLLTIKKEGQQATNEMKKMTQLCKEQFSLDKCEQLTWLDGTNAKTRNYLWAQLKYGDFVDEPISISIFVDMSKETQKPRYRFSLELKDNGTNKEVLENYHRHLDIPIQPESLLVYMSGSNELNNLVVINADRKFIKTKLQDGTYKKIQICHIVDWNDELTNDEIERAMIDGIRELIPYYEHVIGIDRLKYWPTLEEYDPGITKQMWSKLLTNKEMTNLEDLKMFKCWLQEDGESTCANLAEKYGGSPSKYNIWGSRYASKVAEELNIKRYSYDNKLRLFPIIFVGREVYEQEKKRYSWKLRDELKEALLEMDLSPVDVDLEDINKMVYDKNIILYGPPGTGKTYNTVIYAVAICDNLNLDEVQEKPYSEVMKRYKQLVDMEKRVVFTTFHQSYGYEEFIEGIKPVVDEESGNISYIVKPGIFKSFCDNAKMPIITTSEFELSEKPNIWKVTIQDGTMNSIKEDCFDKGKVRIGFSKDSADANAFVNKIEKGDIIISLKTRTSIDAIGVVLSEDVDEMGEVDSYKLYRDVKWLATGIDVDIRKINGNKILNRPTVCRVPNMRVEDILDVAKKYNAKLSSTNVAINDKPYVFVIDEINRGNISKIFGELITLIEDTKREGMDEEASAILPYSGDLFSVPSNVYILGTMNTADRSIALMDTALRRRFQFIEMMPDANVLRSIGADKVGDLDVAAMLEKINERITFLYDREHTIGHAFFTKLAESPDIETLKSIFEKSVIPLLQEYFYEDYQKIQLVLGDNGKTDSMTKFIIDEDVKVKSIFKGNADDVVDLSEKKYYINKAAFDNLESYKLII